MNSWPSRSATTGTNSCPGRTARESCEAPSTVTSGPSRRPSTAAASSARAQVHAVRVSQGRLVHSAHARAPTASASWCCSAASRPSTRCPACRRSTCCGPSTRTATTSRPWGSPARAAGCAPTTPSPRCHRGAGDAARPRPGIERLEATGTAVEPLPAVTPAIGRRHPGRRPAAAARPARGGRHACRGCSSWPACPSSAPACSPRRCAWTSSSRKDVLAVHGIPQVPWVGAARHRARRRRAAASTTPGSATRCS